jgi:DNA-directed RNA polymerase specialized sigma24 family protein
MNDRQLATALREGQPGAAGALAQAHGESILQYCWLMLGDVSDAAAVLHEIIAAATVETPFLDDSGSLRAWLLSLARVRCVSREPGAAAVPAVRPEGPPGMALSAVMSLPRPEREALALSAWHGLGTTGVAQAIGVPAREIPDLLGAARVHLRQAVAAEVMARKDSGDCPARADILADWDGVVTAALAQRLLSHTGSCLTCMGHLPKGVSEAKIYRLLPSPAVEQCLALAVPAASVPGNPGTAVASPDAGSPAWSRDGPRAHRPVVGWLSGGLFALAAVVLALGWVDWPGSGVTAMPAQRPGVNVTGGQWERGAHPGPRRVPPTSRQGVVHMPAREGLKRGHAQARVKGAPTGPAQPKPGGISVGLGPVKAGGNHRGVGGGRPGLRAHGHGPACRGLRGLRCRRHGPPFRDLPGLRCRGDGRPLRGLPGLRCHGHGRPLRDLPGPLGRRHGAPLGGFPGLRADRITPPLWAALRDWPGQRLRRPALGRRGTR